MAEPTLQDLMNRIHKLEAENRELRKPVTQEQAPASSSNSGLEQQIARLTQMVEEGRRREMERDSREVFRQKFESLGNQTLMKVPGLVDQAVQHANQLRNSGQEVREDEIVKQVAGWYEDVFKAVGVAPQAEEKKPKAEASEKKEGEEVEESVSDFDFSTLDSSTISEITRGSGLSEVDPNDDAAWERLQEHAGRMASQQNHAS